MLRAVASLCMAAALAAAVPAHADERVIRVTARRFEYDPNEIILKRGEPVILELTSLDRVHGFHSDDLGVRVDVKPGEITRVRLVPEKTGRFSFACDVFCGDGHEDMTGEIIVVD